MFRPESKATWQLEAKKNCQRSSCSPSVIFPNTPTVTPLGLIKPTNLLIGICSTPVTPPKERSIYGYFPTFQCLRTGRTAELSPVLSVVQHRSTTALRLTGCPTPLVLEPTSLQAGKRSSSQELRSSSQRAAEGSAARGHKSRFCPVFQLEGPSNRWFWDTP